MKNSFAKFFFFLFLSQPLWSEEFSLKDLTSGKELNSLLQLYEDKEAKKKFQEVLDFQTQEEFSPMTNNSFGYSKSTYWLKLEVINPSDASKEWVLEFDYPSLDVVDLYRESTSLTTPDQSIGDSVPFSRRLVEHRNPVFLISSKPNSKEALYLRVQTTSAVIISTKAYDKQHFYEKLGTENLLLGFYYGSMLVMFFYNVFLFLSTRDKSYLYYFLYIIGYIAFQFTSNGLSFQYLWPNSLWWSNYALPFFIFFGFNFLLFFSRTFLQTKTITPIFDKLHWALIAYAIVGIFGTLFFFPYSLAMKLALLLTFSTVVLVYINGFVCIFKGQRSSRFFLIAWTALLIGITLYALKTIGILPENFVTHYGIQIGSLIEVVLLSLGLADRINFMSKSLETKVIELGEANVKIRESVSRLRGFFESSDQIIFVLDQEGNFISINKAITFHLGYSTSELLATSIFDLMKIQAEQPEEENISLFLAKEKWKELLGSRKSVNFQTEFRHKYMNEPRDFTVLLQSVEVNERIEILGTANTVLEDALSKYIKSERIIYETNNYLKNAELICQKLTSNLQNFTEAANIIGIRTCLREMLINAVEHGNLAVTYDEKTETQLEGNYLEFIKERQEDERYKNRKVVVEYSLNKSRVAFRITDEGKGFNHQKALQATMEERYDEDATHGRGLIMAKKTFDILEYNERGNQVTLVKYFAKN